MPTRIWQSKASVMGLFGAVLGTCVSVLGAPTLAQVPDQRVATSSASAATSLKQN
jgi:hypothetical protein